jgi:hypothetical protein
MLMNEKNFRRHPEVLAAQWRASSIGSRRRCSRPSIETPRKGAAPQDDAGAYCGLLR